MASLLLGLVVAAGAQATPIAFTSEYYEVQADAQAGAATASDSDQSPSAIPTVQATAGNLPDAYAGATAYATPDNAGPGTGAIFTYASGVTFEGSGTLVIADASGHFIGHLLSPGWFTLSLYYAVSAIGSSTSESSNLLITAAGNDLLQGLIPIGTTSRTVYVPSGTDVVIDLAVSSHADATTLETFSIQGLSNFLSFSVQTAEAPVPVPEPETLPLLGVALAAATWGAHRRFARSR